MYKHKKQAVQIGGILMALTLTWSTFSAQAQGWEPEGGEIKSVEVVIVKDREIELPPANRIFDRIPPSPVVKASGPMQYQFMNFATAIPELNPRVRPLKLSDEEIAKLYGNYLKAGLGNYGTTYLDGFFNSRRNKDYSYGSRIKYLNQGRGPVDKSNSASGELGAELFGKYFTEQAVVSGGIGFNRQKQFFYGYPEGLEFPVERDTIRQILKVFSLNAGIENANKNQKLQYNLGMNFDYLADSYAARESELALAFKSGYDFGEATGIDLKSDLHLITRKDELVEAKVRSLFRIRPTVRFEYEGFKIMAGFNAVVENDTIQNADKLHLYPVARASMDFMPGWSVFAGIDGDMERVSLRSLLAQNPFLAPNVGVFHSNKTFSFYGGLQGKLGSALGLKTGFELSNYKNLFFFINSEADQAKFDVVYDVGNTSFANYYAEMSFSTTEKLRLALRGDLYGYGTDQVEEAWHRPTYRLGLLATGNVVDKLLINADFFVLGGIRAFDWATNQAVKLDSALDFNLKVDYLFSKKFSVFLQGNNLFNSNYQLQLNYPVRGVQVMAGITYSF
jgi:hypothetical protein